MTSYFYFQSVKNYLNAPIVDALEQYSNDNKKIIYLLVNPLTDQRYNYSYERGFVILSPGHRITILNYGQESSDFDNYVEDIFEDIGVIADKYNYKSIIGRPRIWKREVTNTSIIPPSMFDAKSLLESTRLTSESDVKKAELILSLFIGSINDVKRVKEETPQTLLDKVKQKIQLFDGDQTRFVYKKLSKPRTTIQGLSGTGKTELLLHKLKDLYISEPTSKIFFTCHNRILASSLKKRIPQFFNFMKVEQQIEWNERLWCEHAWGSNRNPNSGAYRYICAFYEIPFQRFSYSMSFSQACDLAYSYIQDNIKSDKFNYALTYMFIDESQDFNEHFFRLCELVTERQIFIAGDIFQNIFDENFTSEIQPDYLLGKVYRTDPRTLMFAHGMGMGLFESTKLRWLEKKEWEDCGYIVDLSDDVYYLSREPLRRFEDIDANFKSIHIREMEETYSDSIISIIKEIFENHPTATPDDIGIILIDKSKDIYELADILEQKVNTHLKLDVNKAYESKERIPGQLLISNRNNVKGLEFPFVICVTKDISRSLSYRNALYTMLTRSFLQSYLLVSPLAESGLTKGMFEGLSFILENNMMKIQEPTEEEKTFIQTQFKTEKIKESHYDTMVRILDALNIEEEYREKLINTSLDLGLAESSDETIRKFILQTIDLIKR